MPKLTVEGFPTVEVEAGKRLVLAIEEDAGVDVLHACGGNRRNFHGLVGGFRRGCSRRFRLSSRRSCIRLDRHGLRRFVLWFGLPDRTRGRRRAPLGRIGCNISGGGGRQRR